MRTFPKPSLQENMNGKTVPEHDHDGYHSKENTPKHIPIVEVHLGCPCKLIPELNERAGEQLRYM